MRIHKLKKGMIIKNYKELCKILEIEEKEGNSKKAQFKEMARFFRHKKIGHKFKIMEIYKEPLPVIDGRGKNPNSHKNSIKPRPQLKVPQEHYNSIGVYAIISNHQIYIGSTISGFKTRFSQHKYKDNPLITKEMLEDEKAKFVMLKEMNNSSEFEIRLQEEEYIQHYINNTDWEVMNITSTVKIKGRRKVNEPKPKFKSIKVLETDYEKAIQILKDNGIEIR